MNLSELQAELRHFAAERDWQPFHTPKNLSTALMVEAAELAEIFQWMTPEQSQVANLDRDRKGRIADEVADVLLYLLQLADHCQVDLAQAAVHKLARNALKYPAARTIARVSPMNAAVPGVHVLLDYENVQPSEAALRELVPDVSQVWVFHGPHQRQVERAFAGFGDAVMAVPISKTGKNALDFHLSFYMGYIASRNPSASLVVVANDKGYEPMLEHARAMGFAARQLGVARVKKTAAGRARAKPVAAVAQAEKVAVKKPAAKKAPAKKAAARKAAVKPPEVAATKLPKPPVPAKKTTTAKKATPPRAAAPAKAPAKTSAPKARKAEQAVIVQEVDAQAAPSGPATVKRLVESLRRMGEQQRPTKTKSLWRVLKSFLGTDVTDDAVDQALARLVRQGVVKVNSVTGVSYPQFSAP
jgi:NTP pyrophosphatase (non-canonical NTP hydrolase)